MPNAAHNGAHQKLCATCGGTGWCYANRSWFSADGLYKLRCGVCSGTGRSNYRGDREYTRFQSQCRAKIIQQHARSVS